jgi:hypothetical protein
MIEVLGNSSEPQFSGFDELLESFTRGQLSLNKVQEASRRSVTNVTTNPDTWVSITHRNDNGTLNISIGEKKLPANIERQWVWGAKTAEGQFLLKTAHEYAHAVQHAYDGVLLAWLDRRISDVPDWSESYLRLYGALKKTGALSGLAAMDFYHEQSRTTGNLHVPTHEDMAEFIGAFIVSDTYFDFRMQNARKLLPNDAREEIKILVKKVVEHYIESQSRNK